MFVWSAKVVEEVLLDLQGGQAAFGVCSAGAHKNTYTKNLKHYGGAEGTGINIVELCNDIEAC
jgi:hypothetical protein